MQTFAIGVDLGGSRIIKNKVDANGKLLEKLTLGTEVSRGRDFVIQDMCAAIEQVRAKYKDAGTLCGIGIGVPASSTWPPVASCARPISPTGRTSLSARSSRS